MKTLILDTSTNYLVVGLLNGNKQTLITRIGKNDNSAYIVNKIDELFKKENTNIDEIDQIIVGVGPGSYTGVRVSVVVAKTLSYTKNIKLKKISSLALLSSGYNEKVEAAIDARRNHYFSGTYLKGKEIIKDSYKENSLVNKDILVVLNENTIKINIKNIINNASLVKDVFNLEPNYLRITEAERNYDKRNDTL